MLYADTQQALKSALGGGDEDRAAAIAEAALADGQRHVALYLLAGIGRLRRGDAQGAVLLLSEAERLQPGLPQVLMALGDALRFTGQLREARERLEAAIALVPGHPGAWYSHALTLEGLGLLEAALGSYARVAALAPHTAPGHAGMAAVQAQLGQTEAARAAAAAALALAPDDAAALIALARCHIAEQRHEEALVHLEPLATRPDLLPPDRIVAMTLLGDAHDQIGNTAAAFAAYSAAKSTLAATQGDDGAGHIESIDAIARAVDAAPAGHFAGPAPAAPGAAANHIFLIGYPRSGVTLVEQVLATAPGVETLEEHPTLAEAAARYLHEAGLAALGSLSEAEALALRSGYWQAVRGLGIATEGQCFVDMEPMKTLHLPLIARLFPDARVVMVRRDPRDVVWSCFRRTLVVTDASREFNSLERAARHYDRMMRLAETCLSRLPLDVHIVDYGRLVSDFDAETQALCAFAGLPWSEAMRNFDVTARRRAVSTRSAGQVRRGLFNGGGQWRRYEAQLAPVLPVLEPWVRKFGYA